MKIVLGLSILLLLVVSAPYIRGARHTILIAGVAVLVFLSGFGIKGTITSVPVLLLNTVVNLAVTAVLWVRLDKI